MDQLLRSIQQRSQKQTEFAYGILTADKYVATLGEYVGPEGCRRITGNSRTGFHDLLRKASNTLVYSNPEMLMEQITGDKRMAGFKLKMELPKNTLMSFRHVLTSSMEDRDGDTLHSDGATIDPKMLLLWQHVHTQPIGKYLVTIDQSTKRLVVESCIVDVNKLCHDAAVMVDNDMGRFSHGFRALEFTETKARDPGRQHGFDVTKFEIMEESLVSVPANIDARTEEVILSLVEGHKLTSPLMKCVGRGIRDRRNVSVPGISIKYRETKGDETKELECHSLSDLKTAAESGLIGGIKDENESRDRAEAGAGAEVKSSTPEEADVDPNQIDDKKASADEEVTCPDCDWSGPMPKDGKCPECGASIVIEKKPVNDQKMVGNGSFAGSWEDTRDKLAVTAKTYLQSKGLPTPGDNDGCVSIDAMFDDYAVVSAYWWNISTNNALYEIDWEEADGTPVWSGDPRKVDRVITLEQVEKSKSFNDQKLGRVLSKSNEQHIKDAMDCHKEVFSLGSDHASRSCRALIKEAHGHLDTVVKSIGEMPPEETDAGQITVKDAMATFIVCATPEQRKQMVDTLKAIDQVTIQDKTVADYLNLKGEGPGHPFRGNQFSGGRQASKDSNKAKKASTVANAATAKANKDPSRQNHQQAAFLHREAKRSHERADDSNERIGNYQEAKAHQAAAEQHGKQLKIHEDAANRLSGSSFFE
jgi:hypothetical protein